MNKQCNKCLLTLPISDFGRYNGRKKTLYRNRCKECRNEDEKYRYENQPGRKEEAKKSARKSQLKRYGIDEKIFKRLLKEQGNCCAICNKEFTKTPNIDHCHTDGYVRGLLCWNCNIALGYFKDNINILNNAIEYLKESKRGI